MLIQITNTCRMGCPHCMDAATPEPNHMTKVCGVSVRKVRCVIVPKTAM